MAKVNIKWSPRSLKNLEEITEFISQNSPFYAQVFVKKIISSVERLVEFPLSGRVVPEFNNKEIREVIFHNYRIVYRIKCETVEIVLITHGARIIN